MSFDLLGAEIVRPPFQDIPNQRDSVAENKAVLCKQLGELCRTPPSRIRGGGILETRKWMEDCRKSKSVLASRRSSVNELTIRLAQMRSYL